MNQELTKPSPLPEIISQIAEYLDGQGYQVTKEAKVRGKSGILHNFNLTATQDDGFSNYTIALNVSTDTDQEAQLSRVFDFANIAFDTGIRDKILITLSNPFPEVREFAQKQRLRIIRREELKTLLAAKPTSPASTSTTTQFNRKDDLLEALRHHGYRVEEKASVRGRSGADYTFDILAYTNRGLMSHSLCVDIIGGNGMINLEQVSVFDTKAYDTGIGNKVIFATSKLTPKASQFAQHQQIRILQSDESTPEDTGEKEARYSIEKPADTGRPEAAKDTLLRTRPQKQKPQPEALQLIPEVMARRYNAVPISITGNTLLVAMGNPTDIFALEAFAAQSKKRIRPVAATSEEVRESIDQNYQAYGEIEKQLSHVSINNETSDENLAVSAAIDAPLAQALNLIIEEAAKARSSDIHIEPEENRLRIRFRIDGTLHDTMSLPLNIHRALISRIKILGQMNIADHYRPQDGQFSVQSKGRQLDIRIATAPTVHGEMVALRLLDKSRAMRSLSDLGMLPESLARYEEILKNPYGMILVSGPTGSGKTTTLYASINTMDTISKNIITIEDPAEYRFKDINQIQVNPQAGITFASGLRSILRLDPNVIMVGEIRDLETANIATQAALTGHLMLSSIHANDSAGTIFRLFDLGIEPFLIASAIIGIVAQRMVRRICPDCSRLIEAPVVEQIAYEKATGERATEFRYGTGCATCSYTGYLGRNGLFEIMKISDPIRIMIARHSTKSEIRDQALKEGMVPMIKDGMLKVKAGITTPSEVLNAAYTQE
ncbi:MAG: GspE/PulE family protein [Chloroflexota bacterium]